MNSINETEINDIENKEKKKFKMTKYQICSVIFALLFLIVGFLVGKSLNTVEKLDDYKVYVEGEEQVFRNSVGKKVMPISIDNQIYIPVSSLGSHLGYMTIQNDDLYLYRVEDTGIKKLQGFSTETFDGDKIDESVFSEADYTVFMLWATWCKYCKAELEDFQNLNEYIKENNIQFISIVTDLPLLKDKGTLTKSQVEEVNKLIGTFDIKYNVLRDNVINTNLIGNTVSIPKLVIFDNQGNLIKIIEKDITSEEFITIFDLIKG